MVKKEKQQSDCTGYYEVSVYTTDDGKKVDGYTRRCWKHGEGGAGSSVQNTQNNIEKTNEKLDEINNKEEITDKDLDLSRGYLSATISQICDDCENYMDEENENKVEIPTFESIEKSKDLKNTKNKILDNIENSMHTVNKIEKIQQKKWDSVNMTDTDYNSKLYKYAKSKEIIQNINKNLRYLHEAVSNSWGIAKNFIGELKNEINKTKDALWNKTVKTGEDFAVEHANKTNAKVLGAGFAKWKKLSEAYDLFKIGLRDNNYNEDYVNQNGELHNSINDIDSSKYNIQEIKNRVNQETKGRMKDCKVLVLRPDSSMAEKIKMSSTFHNFLNKNLDTLKQKGSIPDTDIEFKGSDSDLYNSFHGANIKDIKYKNGEVSLKVEDFYNFNKGRTSARGRVGEKLQNQGDLENYYIIVDIKFKL